MSNVGRDQYIEWRESFARNVFAAKTKARILVWLGFLWTAIGAVAVALFIWAFNSVNVGPDDPIPPEPAAFGYAFTVGAIAALGQFVVIAGVVLHIVAAARRRTLNHNPPVNARACR